jgi:hypothetical protein
MPGRHSPDPGKKRMKSLGMWMVILSLGSFVLRMMGMDFILISWMDNWGDAMGTGLRLGAAAVGAVLFVIGMKQEAAEPASS